MAVVSGYLKQDQMVAQVVRVVVLVVTQQKQGELQLLDKEMLVETLQEFFMVQVVVALARLVLMRLTVALTALVVLV